LEDYAANDASSVNPLAALSPRARRHFIASLRFGPQGLASFSTADLENELSVSEAYRLLALFGMQATVAVIPGLAVKTPEDVGLDTWRREAVQPDFAIYGAMCNSGGHGCVVNFRSICWDPCSAP
jgi:hypothetical protein